MSANKGVQETIGRIIKQKGNAFALFLKNQKRWTSKPYEQSNIDEFHANCKEHSFDPRRSILPHGSYLINLANPDAAKLKQSQEALLDDLQRCESLDIGLYNLHPGSSLGTDMDKAVAQIASSINEVHSKTSFVKVVLENMTGNPDRIVGTKLEHLASIISQVKDKDRVGVCIDTCHSFCAGYDLRTSDSFNKFWDHFNTVIGWKYLSGIHLNDSKYPFDSKRDVHQNLGLGFLGLETFRLIMNKPELMGIPLILETPLEGGVGQDNDEDSARRHEIELLRWLEGKEADDKEVLAKSKELQDKGRAERDKCQAVASKRKAGPAKKKGEPTNNKKIKLG